MAFSLEIELSAMAVVEIAKVSHIKGLIISGPFCLVRPSGRTYLEVRLRLSSAEVKSSMDPDDGNH